MKPGLSLQIHHRYRPFERIRLHPQPESGGGVIMENEPYVLIARGDPAVGASELYVDGERLTALRSESPGEARWQWSPGFYAGEVVLELSTPGHDPFTLTAITDPARRKLTREEYSLMVGEILEDSRALLSLAGHRFSLGHGSASPIPPVARLEWLWSRSEAIEESVRRIDECPATILSAENQPVPISRAKRVRARELVGACQTGQMRQLPDGHVLRRRDRMPHLPDRIRKREPVAGPDIPEHRQIKAALRNWADWLAAVSDALSSEVERPGRIGARARVWVQRCRKMARSFHSLRELPTFASLPDAPGGVRLTSRFRRVTRYRRFYRLYQDLRRAACNVFGDQVDVPLSETYRLYEFWAYLRTVRALAEDRGLGSSGLDDLLETDPGSGSFWFRPGPLTVRLGDGTAVAYKPSYRPYWKSRSGVGSYSRSMHPDIVVTQGEDRDGTPGDRIILDAKYRVGASLGDAVTSAHSYRDALLEVEDDGAAQRPAISGVYLLSPYTPEAWPDWREAPMPDRLFQDGYRRRFQFGAVEFRPGMDPETLRGRLDELMDLPATC